MWYECIVMCINVCKMCMCVMGMKVCKVCVCVHVIWMYL